MIVIPRCNGSHMRCEDEECRCACHGTRARVKRTPRAKVKKAAPPRVARTLTPAEIEEARAEYAAGGVTMLQLARRYHCHDRTVSAALEGVSRPLKFTEQDKAEARRMYTAGGITVEGIAKHFKISETRASAALQGLTGRNAMSEEVRCEVLASRHAGESISSIARRLRLDRGAIYRVLEKAKAVA